MTELLIDLPEVPKILAAMPPETFRQALKEIKEIKEGPKRLINLIKEASELEKQIALYKKTYKRFCDLNDQLYCETGEGTPNLRELLMALDTLTFVRVRIID